MSLVSCCFMVILLIPWFMVITVWCWWTWMFIGVISSSGHWIVVVWIGVVCGWYWFW